VGQQVIKLLHEQGDKAIAAEARLENREAILRELDALKPDYIINAAGKVEKKKERKKKILLFFADWSAEH
jgi:hypothetical protein